jgi:hypothetical protein
MSLKLDLEVNIGVTKKRDKKVIEFLALSYVHAH